MVARVNLAREINPDKSTRE